MQSPQRTQSFAKVFNVGLKKFEKKGGNKNKFQLLRFTIS